MNAADVDKYATLFTPSTPRASPILAPTGVDVDPPPLPHSRQRSNSDDFGAFVSVPSSADPLAAEFFGAEDPPLQFESKRHDDCDTTAAQPSTLQFFDQVGRDARAATDLKRKSFLEELLLHEDDPMYFLEPQSQGPEQEVKQTTPPEHDPADLDLHFFRPPPVRAEKTSVNSSPKMPMKTPPLAPALTSSPDAIIADPFNDWVPNSNPDGPGPRMSPSYASISSLPSKWMNSLLRGQQPPTAKPSLESIFSDLVIPSSTPSLHKKSSSGILDFPETNGGHHSRSSSHPPSADNQPRNPAAFASLPIPPQHYRPKPVQLTHSTPFTPPNNTIGGASIYIPPTGAPGFKGEDHDWDKGFSNELEEERRSGIDNTPGNPPIDTDRLNYTEQADREEQSKMPISTPTMKPPGIEGVGAFIEKKVGTLELIGRKASTIPILNVELGLQVCDYPCRISNTDERCDNDTD